MIKCQEILTISYRGSTNGPYFSALIWGVKLASQAEIEITCPRESVVREILGRTGCENMMFL
jgi:hypothetical protein